MMCEWKNGEIINALQKKGKEISSLQIDMRNGWEREVLSKIQYNFRNFYELHGNAHTDNK